MSTAARHCMELVKRSEHAHYLCALLVPSASRDAQMALRAFNIETASIMERVTDPHAAKLRFSFWRIQLGQMFDGGQDLGQGVPPVITELSRAHTRWGLSRRWFDRVLQAREGDTGKQPETVKEVEEFGEGTSSSLMYLSLEALGVREIQADHAASHLGKALAIGGLLRGLPHHIQKQQIFVPAELFRTHKVETRAVLRGDNTKELEDAVFELATWSKQHLDHARELTVPNAAMPALLPAAICEQYLKALEKANFNVFDPRLQQPIHFWLQVCSQVAEG
eukprot:TRINITY_DN7211_c0_g1_i1.p1 TRINITY_DN7211_c0_g1~~TRINITY_DN7211_c0_g1_i1.p1  ORF type:complete len:279 (-),score=65.19 TRINITY_DN7211_c0_g1_i1:413-1249(-)